MTLFQILAVASLAVLSVLTLAATWRGWVTRRECLFWLLVWVAATVAIVWPDVTKRIARAVGIGRGADLVLYCSVAVLMVGFLMVYVRVRRLRREMTLLVRALAIQDASIGAPPSPTVPGKCQET